MWNEDKESKRLHDYLSISEEAEETRISNDNDTCYGCGVCYHCIKRKVDKETDRMKKDAL